MSQQEIINVYQNVTEVIEITSGEVVENIYVTEEVVEVIELLEQGMIGPVGPQGIAGPQGLPGTGGDLSYTHTQMVASAQWNVAHNLGKHPSVRVVDSGGTDVEGDYQDTDANNTILTFSVPFTGKAYFN